MFKSSKTLLALSVLLAVLAIMLVGCNKQAASSSQAKTEAKSSLAAPADTNTPACKTAVKKECKAEKKVCPKKAAKKHCPMMVEKKCCHKMTMDANDAKHCPMKDKKACPPNCKKPCCAKKMVKCVSDANAAAKPCEKMTCAVGDGKAANKNICAEYKGKKYCFCCEGCKKQFEKDPEKCINKCK
jgi:YHS domain-containing protein